MGKWFRPSGTVAKKIAAVLAETEEVSKKAQVLMKRVGASAVYSPINGNYQLVGFEFDAPPDPKLWKKTKNNGWVPKRTTNQEVHEAMLECHIDTYRLRHPSHRPQ
jgi:hypothetical protein